MTARDNQPAFQRPVWLILSLLILLLRTPWICAGERDFSIVILPDPQHYASKYPKIGMSQTQWIKDNVEKLHIKFVTSVGDNVDAGYKEAQYKNSRSFFAILDEVVPYGIACGNHDLMDGKKINYSCQNFVEYYGPQHFKKYPWYGGASESGFSSWQKFSGGGQSFLILHLAVNAPRPEMEWAKKVLADHPTQPAILVTHQLLTPKAVLGKSLAAKEPGRQNPVEIWDQLIKPSPQIFMVLCGHYHGEAYLAKKNAAGHPVHLILQDYQRDKNGGNGWLRILNFKPDQKKAEVQTYSPSLNKYQRDADSEFSFDLHLERVGVSHSR